MKNIDSNRPLPRATPRATPPPSPAAPARATAGRARALDTFEPARPAPKAAAPQSAAAPATVVPPRLPSADGTGALSPWGGADPSRWRPEAIIANGASKALNDAWALPGVRDAVVAIPTRIQNSDYHPYGDGQENAAASFVWWQQPRPPVVGTLVTFQDGSQRALVRFDRALPIATDQLEALSSKPGEPPRTITAHRDENGDLVASIDLPPGSAVADPDVVTLIHPKGWEDWFPLRFRTQATPISSLLDTVPEDMRHFADGRSIVDPMNVSAQGNATPFEKLQHSDFGGDFNDPPFNVPDVHGDFPDGDHSVTTGVGRGWTWVANEPKAPFKVLYTAFEGRRPDLEAQSGVPTGGGWHSIGDPAETILDSVESAPFVVGYAQNNPFPEADLPYGHFSYGLSDVANVRWLQPGEAFTVAQGGTTRDHLGHAVDQTHYHWFLFNADRPTVTEEWVHPWRPQDGKPVFGPRPS